MATLISHSISETQEIATNWLKNLATNKLTGKNSEATIIALSGPLGSGKTAFTQAVARTFGIDETVTSPTFVIMKIYDIKNSPTKVPWKKLIHIDAYRLNHGKEMDALNFESLVADPQNLILIEWGENVKEALPPSTQWIKFEHVGESERRISFL